MKDKDNVNVSIKNTYIIVFTLFLFAIIVISIRTASNSDADLPGGDSAWAINIQLQVEAFEKNASVSIPSPWDTPFVKMFAQSLEHPDLRLKRTKNIESKRDITLVAVKPGKYLINSKFDVHVSSLPRHKFKAVKLSEVNRSLWLSSSEAVQVSSKAALVVLDGFPSTDFSTDELIENLFNYVSSNIRIRQNGNVDSDITLIKRRGSELGLNNVLLALFRTAHLPARLVTGVNLQDKSSSQPYYWIEVHDGETWLPMDVVHGHMKQLPAFYVPLRKGGNDLFVDKNVKVLKTNWSINTLRMPNQYLDAETKRVFDIFNFDRLSPSNRENLGILLLLPLGVLATEILRQLGGIRTYGTFTPTLLALAIVHIDRITALIIFSLVIVIGVVIRSLLPNFDLEKTARLAIVFTLVSASMSIVTSGLLYFDPSVDSMVVLLPIVILTMLVDRIYSISDERGVRTAMIRLFWTLVSAFISLVVLWQIDWSRWLVSYPETHLLTLTVIISIGLYRGRKLSELPVFSWLREPALPKSRKKSAIHQSEQSGDKV